MWYPGSVSPVVLDLGRLRQGVREWYRARQQEDHSSPVKKWLLPTPGKQMVDCLRDEGTRGAT